MNDTPKGNYAEVNGLNMYYEIHSTGQPLVLLHGAYMTIDAMGEIVSGLAQTRQVIAAEGSGSIIGDKHKVVAVQKETQTNLVHHL